MPAAEDAEPPKELALVATDLLLAGPTELNVVPGETFTIAHVMKNPSSGRVSAGLVARPSSDRLLVDPLVSSLRLESGEARGFGVEVVVPADAEVGTTYTFKLTAGTTGGTQPATHTVNLAVVDVAGQRPTIGPVSGETTTNEQVSMYVLASASDSDANLDQASLGVVWHGFVSDDVSAANGTVTYVPFKDVTGTDAVIYQLCDLEGLCATAVAEITINSDG